MTVVSVRRAVLEDAAAIAAVHAAARIAGYRDFVSEELLRSAFSADTAAIWKERWKERLGAKVPPVVLVAVRGDQLAGYCMLLLPSDDEDSRGVVAELTRMSVIPEAWGSGVGTVLMNETLDLVRRAGWEAMSLWVLNRNLRAQAFYSRFGFEPDGAEMIDAWCGQTEVRMRLPLADAKAARASQPAA
ncbi:MAG TPA: GNAT family N-acetyltransferase [Solirubrobacteraceae bacterium]|nr:GNAT family N-acetyltransferase [Solirubrobacteraceae bacterium]